MLLSTFMTDDLERLNISSAFRRDVIIASIFICILGLIGFYDLYEDWLEGVSINHLYFEGVINIVELLVGLYLFLTIAGSKKRTVQKIHNDLLEARKSATDYKLQVNKFKEGISDAISDQFQVWKLTPAEQDICLLLLKGFSLQEMSELRDTSERTIRQQASTMYKKTGLSGRAQLSAFFLEDMLAIKQ